MFTAGIKLRQITVALAASAVLWAGAAEAKTTAEEKKAAAKKQAAEQKAASPKAKKEKSRVEADVIANLDDLAQCGAFKDAEVAEDRAKAKKKKKARRRVDRRRARKASPEVGDLFRGEKRAAARPRYREIGYVARKDLSPTAVQRVIRRYRDQVAHCFARGARSGSGEVLLSVVVAPEGKVSSVKISTKGAGARRVRRCLAPRVKRWSFPAASASTEVEFPFVFTADRR